MTRRDDYRQDEADLDAIWNAAGVCIIAALVTIAALVGYGVMKLMGVM